MKSKLIMTAGAGLVLCALACTVRADFLPGSYTYKLVLRDDQGFALSGTTTSEKGDERVSANYTIEVYNAAGDKLNATVADASIDKETGCNCSVSVPVGNGAGYAKVGDDFKSTRLVGRSVWNDRWLLVIPASSLNANRAAALEKFVNGIDDIKIGIRAYSRQGN